MRTERQLLLLIIIILSTSASIVFIAYSFTTQSPQTVLNTSSNLIGTIQPELKTVSTTDYSLSGGPPETYSVIQNLPMVTANYLNFMGVGFEPLQGTLNGSSTFSHSSFLSMTDDGNGNTNLNASISSFNDSTDSSFANQCLSDVPTSVKCYSDVSVTAGNIIGGNKDEYITATAILQNGVLNSPLTTITVYKWSNITNAFETFDSFNLTNVFVTSILTQDFLNTGIKQLVIGGYNFNGINPTIDTDSFGLYWYSNPTGNVFPYSAWIVNYTPNGRPVSNPSNRTTIVNGATIGKYVFSIGSAIDTGQLEPSLFGNESSKLVYGNSPTNIIRYSKFGLLSFGPVSLDNPPVNNVSLYSFDLMSSKFVKTGEFMDKMSRPIFADFNNNGQDLLIIPEALWGTNGDPNNPTGPAGFYYSFDPLVTGNTSVWKKGDIFKYYGPIGAGRLTGVDTDIIAFEGNDFQTSDMVIFSKNNPNLLNPTQTLYPMAISGDVHESYYASGKIQTADINQNGREAIIFPWMMHVNDYGKCCPDATARNYVGIFDYNNTNQIGPDPYYNFSGLFFLFNPFELTNSNYVMNNYCNRFAMGYGNTIAECPSINSKVAFGDFFGWSMVGKFQAPSFATLGRPKIVAILAAPPMVGNSSQYFGNSDTSFKTTSSSSSSSGTSSSIDTGGSISWGFETEANVFGATFGFEASAGVNWDAQTSTTTTSTFETDISNQWGTDPYNDGVIFASTSYINYNYTIIEGPSPKVIGTTITVTLPYHTDIMKTNLNFFEEIYAYSNYNLNGRIPYFNHTIGNPTTYPAYNDINQTLIKQNNHNSLVFLTDTNHQNTVGQGNWLDALDLQMSSQMSKDQQWSLSSGIQTHTKVTAADVTFETDFHFDAGYGGTLSTSIGSGTTFHCDIGQFSDAQQWANYKYNYGFFIYSFHDPVLNQDYLVVNYYTGEFGPALLQGKLIPAPSQPISPGVLLSTITSQPVVNLTSMICGTISLLYIGKNGLKLIRR